MPTTCVGPGCKSGYAKERNESPCIKYGWHKFPTDSACYRSFKNYVTLSWWVNEGVNSVFVTRRYINKGARASRQKNIRYLFAYRRAGFFSTFVTERYNGGRVG